MLYTTRSAMLLEAESNIWHVTPEITYSPALHRVTELKRIPQGRRAGNLFKTQVSNRILAVHHTTICSTTC
jgi:hypothetical protein